MRQLNQTGYMHNRLRMVAASFPRQGPRHRLAPRRALLRAAAERLRPRRQQRRLAVGGLHRLRRAALLPHLQSGHAVASASMRKENSSAGTCPSSRASPARTSTRPGAWMPMRRRAPAASSAATTRRRSWTTPRRASGPWSATRPPEGGRIQLFMSGTRTEKDSFGPIEVPAERLWGAQTQRSRRFFRISERTHAAGSWCMRWRWSSAPRRGSTPTLGLLDAEKAEAIVARGRRGAGRPTRRANSRCRSGRPARARRRNMNVNEVLANRASELLGGERGPTRLLHPNDDVNLGQSSNDVFPTAMHVAAARALHPQAAAGARTGCARRCDGEARGLRRHRQDRPHPPAGRDAADAGAGVLRLRRAARASREAAIDGGAAGRCIALAIGGTAVGTGLNTHPRVRRARGGGARRACAACRSSRRRTSSPRWPAHEALVVAHGALKTLAAALMKIANDMRWLASRPALRAGRDLRCRRTSPAARSCRARSTRPSARR